MDSQFLDTPKETHTLNQTFPWKRSLNPIYRSSEHPTATGPRDSSSRSRRLRRRSLSFSLFFFFLIFLYNHEYLYIPYHDSIPVNLNFTPTTFPVSKFVRVRDHSPVAAPILVCTLHIIFARDYTVESSMCARLIELFRVTQLIEYVTHLASW